MPRPHSTSPRQIIKMTDGREGKKKGKFPFGAALGVEFGISSVSGLPVRASSVLITEHSELSVYTR